jgi:TPR repeat protein
MRFSGQMLFHLLSLLPNLKPGFLTLAIIVTIVASPAPAQDISAGLDAFQRGDYASALAQFQMLAKNGDSSAQTSMGIMYDKGHGVEHSPVTAQMWWLIAARGGHEVAFHLLTANAEQLSAGEQADAERMATDWMAVNAR